MLTQQLRDLECDGLVKRIQYKQIPPRVEYHSTGLAHSLEPIFISLVKWSEQHNASISKAQKHYDKNKA